MIYRGFAIDWEESSSMDPAARLREAQSCVSNLDPCDLRPPLGSNYAYLDSAMQRAVILIGEGQGGAGTLSKAGLPTSTLISKIVDLLPEEATPERIEFARSAIVSKDPSTMASEYRNVAETLENWCQAIIAEAHISRRVSAVNNARRNIAELKRTAFDEVRSMNYPPNTIVNIITAVCTLMNDGSTKGGWPTIKRRISNGARFLKDIWTFEPSSLTVKTTNKTKKLVSRYKSDFSRSYMVKNKGAWPGMKYYFFSLLYFIF
jgi:hypothetical protein